MYVVCLINIPIVTSCRILVLLSIAIKNISYSVLFSSCILFTTVELIHLRLFQARFFVIVRTSYVMLQLRFVLHRVNTDEMQNFISSLSIFSLHKWLTRKMRGSKQVGIWSKMESL